MYYQLNEDEVIFQNLKKKIVTDAGEESWSIKGVTVYKWSRSHNPVLRRHRFAVLPQDGRVCDFTIIKADKYYVHVYQTKIEFDKFDLRSLNSRKIARNLKSRCGSYYFPRAIDLRSKNSRAEKTEKRWEDHTETTRNRLKEDTHSVYKRAMSRQKQRWNGPADNRPQSRHKQKKSSTHWVNQHYRREGRHDRTEEHDNRTSQHPKRHQNYSPDRFQSVGVGKSRTITRNIYLNRLRGEINSDEAKIGKLQEVNGELIGM